MIVHSTTYAEYAAMPGYAWSRIRLLHEGGPLHVQHPPRSEDTASRGQLRAIHCLVLEPHTFDRQFSVFDGTRRGRLYEAHRVCHPGTTVLNPREAAEAKATADAVRSHPVVARWLATGDPEVVVTWTDADTGLPCKARIDWLGAVILDLKTLGTTHEGRVARLTAQRLYHGQLAHYAAGLAAHGIVLPAYLVVAEGQPPQDVSVFELDPRGPDGALHVGARLRARLLARIAECEAAGRWPGRHEAPVDLVLPMYALEDEEVTT